MTREPPNKYFLYLISLLSNPWNCVSCHVHDSPLSTPSYVLRLCSRLCVWQPSVNFLLWQEAILQAMTTCPPLTWQEKRYMHNYLSTPCYEKRHKSFLPTPWNETHWQTNWKSALWKETNLGQFSALLKFSKIQNRWYNETVYNN